MPRSLDLDRLQQFQPAPFSAQARSVESTPEEPAAETKVEPAMIVSEREPELRRWPSREPIRDGQISIKAPLDVIDRFRAMCRDDRRTYADMLGILMDGHEGKR